ncbi:MAG: MMPL family transporter, partial [Patescibacteria group bacterium]
FFILFACYAMELWRMNKTRSEWRVQPLGVAASLVAPFLFSTGCLGVVMWWLKIPLSMASAPTAELCVGSASDLGLFLVAAYILFLKTGRAPQNAMRDALRAEGVLLLMDCTLNSVAFAPLWVSSFTPVRQVGIMMVGMLYACGFAVVAFSAPLLVYFTTQNTKKEDVYAANDNGFSSSCCYHTSTNTNGGWR